MSQKKIKQKHNNESAENLNDDNNIQSQQQDSPQQSDTLSQQQQDLQDQSDYDDNQQKNDNQDNHDEEEEEDEDDDDDKDEEENDKDEEEKDDEDEDEEDDEDEGEGEDEEDQNEEEIEGETEGFNEDNQDDNEFLNDQDVDKEIKQDSSQIAGIQQQDNNETKPQNLQDNLVVDIQIQNLAEQKIGNNKRTIEQISQRAELQDENCDKEIDRKEEEDKQNSQINKMKDIHTNSILQSQHQMIIPNDLSYNNAQNITIQNQSQQNEQNQQFNEKESLNIKQDDDSNNKLNEENKEQVESNIQNEQDKQENIIVVVEELESSVEVKVIEIRPKVIYDPKNDVDKYPGNYSDSGESEDEKNNDDDEDEDDEDEEQESDQKSRNNRIQIKKKNAKKELMKKPVVKRVLKKQTLVLNVADTKYPVVKFVGKKIFKWKLNYVMESMDWDIFWTDNAVQPEQLGKMQPYQKINHFPGMFSLARKNHLARNLMKMSKQFPELYKFFPQTWLLPAEYNDFKTQFEKSKSQSKIFIVKPEASCQGRGIFLTRSLDDLNPSDHYVVQRYLTKPYLIDGLKFDFRLYVLLAGCDPLRIYLYYEGLARFATETYKEPNRDNIEDMCMHLTNYAINKDNPNFQFNNNKEKMDVGHKRSLTSVLQLLEDQGHDMNKLWKDIKRVLIKTIISAQPTLAHHYRSCQPDNFANNMCFEVLGFDIILDSQLKPWLLEVNHTPSFVTDTPLDSYIKKNTIRDSLKLMNCSCKAKNEIVNQRKEIMQKRVLTGKKVKYSPEEKQEEIKKAQQKRNEYEDKHLGGFERIFPLQDDEEDKFTEYLAHAQKCYEEQTGANIRRNTKKVTEDPKKITNQPKKLNQPKDLEKIYNTKIGKLPPRKPASQTIINKNIPGQQRPNSSNANLEEGDILKCDEEGIMRDEAAENGQIMRSASGRMHDFRIKKSPYNIHQKFRNKIQGRVAIGVKELKLGDDPFQPENNPLAKATNFNIKKISAYMTSQQDQMEIKNQNILQDQNYNSTRTQPQKRYPEPQVQPVQELPKKFLNLNATKPAQKLQFQIIDNATAMEEERRQWLVQAQRNLQYQLSQQQYQPQQRITLLPKGPSMLPQAMQPTPDNTTNSKDILSAVGGSISGQFKTDKRITYKQKGVSNQGMNQIKDNNNNGLFVAQRLFEIQSFQPNQQVPPQQMNVQSSLDQNIMGMNSISGNSGMNDLFVSGKSHKVQSHYQGTSIQSSEPYQQQKHSNYNYFQK